MSSLLGGTDRISLRQMPLKPHEGLFKLQKRAFRAFKTRSLRGWDLQGSKLKGNYTSALRLSFPPGASSSAGPAVEDDRIVSNVLSTSTCGEPGALCGVAKLYWLE